MRGLLFVYERDWCQTQKISQYLQIEQRRAVIVGVNSKLSSCYKSVQYLGICYFVVYERVWLIFILLPFSDYGIAVVNNLVPDAMHQIVLCVLPHMQLCGSSSGLLGDSRSFSYFVNRSVGIFLCKAFAYVNTYVYTCVSLYVSVCLSVCELTVHRFPQAHFLSL